MLAKSNSNEKKYYMKSAFTKFMPVLSLLFLFLISTGQQQILPESVNTSKPWTRWWWMENAVDKENIKRELKEMADAGIGGIEITPIYGVKGAEHRFIEYLTPAFTEILNFTIDEAAKLGMGVDLPPGSGWRCGGPFVPGEKGLWSMKIQKTQVKKGETWQLPASLKNITAALFVNEKGEKTGIDFSKKFTVPANGTVYLAQRVKNGDKVKRPSNGGQGWAVDTFNEPITNWYLGEFWKRLGIDEGKLRCFFHDSFEYTGDFTPEFTKEFYKRRGYQLAEILFELSGDCTNAEKVARAKSDYRETLSDLVLESFIQPMTAWAHGHKSLNRNQAHGSPGNILDLYAACDIPETEIFRQVFPGTVDVFVNKFASSAAHVTGKKLVASESFTWLEEHWTVTTSDLVRATNRFFLAGINHMFFHGTCYSPSDAEWPGWLFYASTQINNRNPLWPELPALFKYIERSQTILQNALPQNDVLVYWPYYDVAASEGRLFIHLGVNKDAGWFKSHPISELSENLMKSGYTFDYISDKQLLNSRTVNGEIITEGKARYKAIVVPKTKYIPFETLACLKQFIDNGGKVFFDGNLPESVPGMFKLEARKQKLEKLKTAISKDRWVGNVTGKLANSGIVGEKALAEKGFHFLKMQLQNESWYMIFNTGTVLKDEWVELAEPSKSVVFYNPLNGETTRPAIKQNSFRLQLEPEQGMFVKCSNTPVDKPGFIYENTATLPLKIDGKWKVEFIKGGPVLPESFETSDLVSWTKARDKETQRFAGTAGYLTEFNWNSKTGTAFIDLGLVNDCARVKLNGKDFGTLLGPAFKVKVDNLLQGRNRLEVEVTNVAANRIRDLDLRGVNWKNFYDINFVNIDYQPFDASGWEIKDAGLQGPIQIYGAAND